MIHAFMQIANDCSWLNEGSSRKGHDQASSKLKATFHTSDPQLLGETMRSYPRAEDLNTRNRALEGFELFASTKRKLDLPLGFECDSPQPDKVSHFIPRPNRKYTRACIEKSLTLDVNVVTHNINVLELELECLKYHWHIFKLSYSSKKKCQALQANIRHPCKAKVGKRKHGTPVPTKLTKV